jgi:hypothetical protein
MMNGIQAFLLLGYSGKSFLYIDCFFKAQSAICPPLTIRKMYPKMVLEKIAKVVQAHPSHK